MQNVHASRCSTCPCPIFFVTLHSIDKRFCFSPCIGERDFGSFQLAIRIGWFDCLYLFFDISLICRCHKQCYMDKKVKKCLLIVFCSLLSSAVYAHNNSKSKSSFDWHPIMEAIIQVESEGNPRAVKGNSCGAMQITPILVKDCNKILKKRNSKKRYTLADRFSVKKSKEMFLLIQSYYNPTNNIEKAIRAWNGGNNYSVRNTQNYYKRVMKCLRNAS